MLESLKLSVNRLGKASWTSMLIHLAEQHEAHTHPPFFKLPYRWEHTGDDATGFAFGHWHSVHIAWDSVYAEPQHSYYQLLNLLSLQQDDGFIPGAVRIRDGKFFADRHVTFPPLWPYFIEEYVARTGNQALVAAALEALIKQLHWFEQQRRSGDHGFHYIDLFDRQWESGVVEGLAIDSFNIGDGGDKTACIDATSHVYGMYDCAARWSMLLGREADSFLKAKNEVAGYIQNTLFDEELAIFCDSWHRPPLGEGMITVNGLWPVCVGAATVEQARRVINENILEPTRLFSRHPLATVGLQQKGFIGKGWRGGVCNSMIFWVARGCRLYGRFDAALKLLEGALDMTAKQFEATGSLWPYYDPYGKDARTINESNHDALGNNPLIAMAHMWQEIKGQE